MKIGGAYVNVVQGTLDVKNEIGQRSTGQVQTWSPLGTVYKYGTQVQVFDLNGDVIYQGFTSKDEVTNSARQGTGYLDHTIQLMDCCYKADKRLIFASYTQTPAGIIVKDLVTRVLVSEGVTYTASSIAAGLNVTEVVWNGKQISQALTWLANLCGYWWNIDQNNVLWFQPYTGQPAGFVLDGAEAVVDSNLKVTFGNDMYVNRQYVKGAYASTGVRTETRIGDGHTRAYTLSYEIASTAAADLSISVNGVAQTIGTKGQSGWQFYAAVGDATIAQDPSLPLLTSSDTVSVTYKGRYPVLAMAQSPTLISAQKAREGGGTGLVESEYSNASVHTDAAAFQIAGALLHHYGADITQVEVDILASQAPAVPIVGQMLTVNLPDYGLSGSQMLISEVEITDGVNESFNIYYHVTAIGSPYDAAQWQTYWANLMNQSSDPTDSEDVDADIQFAYLFSSIVVLMATVVVHPTHTTCFICGNSTLCGPSLIVC
jgi:hypothetical protein